MIFEKVMNGEQITREEAFELLNDDELEAHAQQIRRKFCADDFDRCSIVNGKSGRCSENCKYCAQSAYYKTGAAEYALLDYDSVYKEAKRNADAGLDRFSVVTSGKNISGAEFDALCKIYERLSRECDIKLCASHGLLTFEQFVRLRECGVERYHNNLETSRRFFPNICTTHTYDEKIEAIKNAFKAGLSVCSGGIIGMGEGMEDRIDMAFTLRELGIKSIPINILNPVKGTPLENIKPIEEGEVIKTIAVFRHILPQADIRMAGGRGLLADKGMAAFQSGANAAISGDMLTTSGITAAKDREMLTGLGFSLR